MKVPTSPTSPSFSLPSSSMDLKILTPRSLATDYGQTQY